MHIFILHSFKVNQGLMFNALNAWLLWKTATSCLGPLFHCMIPAQLTSTLLACCHTYNNDGGYTGGYVLDCRDVAVCHGEEANFTWEEIEGSETTGCWSNRRMRETILYSWWWEFSSKASERGRPTLAYMYIQYIQVLKCRYAITYLNVYIV